MHLESRDPVEVTRVPCDNLITQGQCRGRDEEIGRRNPPAARAQPGIDLGEHARNREGDGEDWDRPQYGLNELLAARSSRRCVGTPAPVKQLCGTHDRETQFEVAPPVYQLGDELCGSFEKERLASVAETRLGRRRLSDFRAINLIIGQRRLQVNGAMVLGPGSTSNSLDGDADQAASGAASSRKCPNASASVGSTKRLSAVDVTSPPRITRARGPSISRPGSPLPRASGRRPGAVTSAVMRMGPRRSAAPRIAVAPPHVAPSWATRWA